MAYLNRDKVMAAEDRRKTIEVEIPEWGGTLRMATMTGADRDHLDHLLRRMDAGEEVPSFRATIIAACAVDAKGQKLFTREDVEALGEKSSKAIGRAFDAAVELGVLGGDQAKDEALGE